MADTRKPLTQILADEFKQNPLVQKKCLESSQKWIAQKIMTRIFDDFPCLASPADFDSYRKNFVAFISTSGDEKAVQQYMTAIIKTGCEELLDKKGKLKDEICQLLGWKEMAGKIENSDLVSAYASAVNMLIIDREIETTRKNEENFLALTTLVNLNFHTWMEKSLNELGFPSKQKLSTMEIIRNPLKKAAIAFSLFAGAAAIGYVVMNLMKPKKEADKNKASESPRMRGSA
jgi:hypothetical protein